VNWNVVSNSSNLLGNQLFIREDGIYEWNGSGEPQKLRGLDGDRFWNRVDLDNLAATCHAVTDAKKNLCLFFLPLATSAGGSQATVSNAIVWDFRNRRWMGPWTFPFGSSAYFNNLVHGGGYSDGDVYKTNTGTNDNGSVIDASFKTASIPPGGIAQKNRWILARHEFEKQALDLAEVAITKGIDMTPYAIENRLKLRNPMFRDTASYGHMGRKPITVSKMFTSLDGKKVDYNVDLFTWEKLDLIEKIKNIIK